MNIDPFDIMDELIMLSERHQIKRNTYYPGQVAQLVGAQSHRLKGHRLDSLSGHIPRFWVQSLARAHTGNNLLMFLSHINVSLSLPLPSSLCLKSINTFLGKDYKTQTEDLNRHFSKEDTRGPIRYMKRCLASLAIREMQIKTMSYHLTPVRMAIINKSTNVKYLGQCGENGEPQCTVGRNADWCSHCGKQYGISSKK